MRLRLTLEDPSAEWPPIDPERVAEERGYRERALQGMLWQFQSVRHDYSVAGTDNNFGIGAPTDVRHA